MAKSQAKPAAPALLEVAPSINWQAVKSPLARKAERAAGKVSKAKDLLAYDNTQTSFL